MPELTPKPLDRFRDLRTRLGALAAEHRRQASAPSRGYDEQKAIDEMTGLSEAMERELELVDRALMIHAEAARVLGGGA